MMLTWRSTVSQAYLPSHSVETSHAFSEHRVVERYFRLPEGKAPPASSRAAKRERRRRTMVDVGAHQGESFRPFLSLGWEVHAFEPDRARREELARFAGRGRVTIHEVALADEESADAPWFVSDEVGSISSLAPFDPSHHASGTVRVTTLARALRAEGVERVDYLKVDAEGFDLQVLRGFPWGWGRYLRRVRPPEVILCEFEDRKTRRLGYGVHDLGGFLVERGYEVFISEWRPIERYGGDHRWRRVAAYPSRLRDPDAWGNFIAVRPPGGPRMASALLDELVADRTKQVAESAKLRAALGTIRDDLTQRNRQIVRLRTSIEQRDETIRRLKRTLEDRDGAIERVNRTLRERDEAIARLRESLGERNRTIADLRAALERHTVAPGGRSATRTEE